ncbi:hypothetical protein Vadar_014886 [Vaccinium darrowii]|uniref:Uncharacterized protein n=1 Tax=Vaccinium darrowii TaxID=229202 RepID=A0ACB7X0R1_9ERIC|nr:hypothetical protein Vadar_014886 [Vaccinium darrowii]
MLKYLSHVLKLQEDFKKVEFWHIGRGSNAHADALASLGSACSDLGGSRSIILGDIPTPSFEPGQEDVMWIAPTSPSWIDPLVAYLRDERLSMDSKAAHRVRCQAASYFLSPTGQLYRRTYIGGKLALPPPEGGLWPPRQERTGTGSGVSPTSWCSVKTAASA